MVPTGPDTKNDCAGEGQQQLVDWTDYTPPSSVEVNTGGSRQAVLLCWCVYAFRQTDSISGTRVLAALTLFRVIAQ
jgi:hypothetical protein